MRLSKELSHYLDRKVSKLTIGEIVLILAVFAYAMIFSYLTILKHYSFRTYAWDLGIYNQAFSTALSGKLFVYNVEFYFTPTKSFFGMHFAPFMFFILPFYALAPGVETLLIIQASALAIGAIPIYLIAKDTTKNSIASLIFSIVYLMNPLVQGMNWYDFHMEVFFTPLTLFAIYYLRKRSYLTFFAFLLLSLSVIEWASFLVMFMAVYVFASLGDKERKVGLRKRVAISSLTLIVAVLWFFTSFEISHALSPEGAAGSMAIANFSVLGVMDVLEIPFKAITEPNRLLAALGYEAGKKLLYVLMVFSPTLFLSFLSPLALIPTLPWFGFSLVSNYAPYYGPAFQYSGLIIPFIFVASIEGSKKITSFADNVFKERVLKKMAVLMLLVTLIVGLFASPISPIFKGEVTYFFDYGSPSVTRNDKSILSVLKIIPKDAKVLTTNRIFPHLSSMQFAYVMVPEWAFSADLGNMIVKELSKINFDYIVISDLFDNYDSEQIYEKFVENMDFGLYARGTGIEVYKEGYSGKPVLILPQIYTAEELKIGETAGAHGSEVIDDPLSTYGKTIFYKPEFSLEEDKIIWYGPYITLEKGNYTAKIRLKISQISSQKLFKVDAVANYSQVRLGNIDIYGDNFSRPYEWRTFDFDFTLDRRLTNIELRGFDLTQTTNLWLDYIEISERQ